MNLHPDSLSVALGHDVADKRLDLLRRIGQVGSISEAARSAGVSYKAAWQAIDTLTNLAGTPLVQRTIGGTGGGGAQLTNAGVQLLKAATLLQAQRTQVLAQLVHDDGTQGAPRRVGLGLRTSMRNQLPVRVSDIQRSGQMARIGLQLAGGATLTARITQESAELLDLRPGTQAIAMAKATAVAIAPPDAALSAQQCSLVGTVCRVSQAPTGDEVVLALPGALHCVGFAAPAQRWEVGDAACAVLEDSAIALAVDP